MKKIKLFIFTLIIIIISSCSNVEDIKPCNCGLIVNDGINIDSNYDICYWLEIKNDCTGNNESFCFDGNVWFNNYVGENICITNKSKW